MVSLCACSDMQSCHMILEVKEVAIWRRFGYRFFRSITIMRFSTLKFLKGCFRKEWFWLSGETTRLCYGEDKWDSFLERIKTLPPENAKMLRPFLTFSAPCYNCGDTAVRVSKTMLDYAGIKSKALLERSEDGHFILRRP